MFASANRPRSRIKHYDFGILNIKAFKRFRLDRFASRHSCHRYLVAYKKNTSESNGSEELRVNSEGESTPAQQTQSDEGTLYRTLARAREGLLSARAWKKLLKEHG